MSEETPTYRQASFKGIPFEVETSETEFGRRVAIHEYINKDLPYAEDMGRRYRKFTVSAFFLGSNHLRDAREFQGILEDEGAGELILPSRQVETVYCIESVRVDNTRSQKRITVFELTFIEAGEFQFPTSAFSSIFNLIDAVENTVREVVQDVLAPIQSFQSAIFRIQDAFLGISGSISRIPSTLDQLWNFIGDSPNQNQVPTSIYALLDISNFSSAGSSPTNGSLIAIQEYNNALQFDVAVRLVAALNSAALISELDFTNRLEAIVLRDQIDQALIQDIESLTIEQCNLVLEVRRAMYIDLTSRIATLPTFIRVSIGESCPSVVVAHKIFGDYKRHEELCEWNPTFHPLFMSETIEAIS